MTSSLARLSLARLVVLCAILLPPATGYVVLPPPRIALVTPRSGAAVGSAVADLSKLTVKQLKEKLKDAGLPVSGKKAELIERLGAGGAAPPAPADDLLLAVDEAAVEVEEAAVEDDAAALEGLSPPPQFEPAPAAAEAGAADGAPM